MKFEFDETIDQRARIKVIGVGGGGGNAINRMIESGIDRVDFISVNTDAQDLEDSKAKTRIQIGKQLTRGLGAGGKNHVGEKAAEESQPAIVNAVKDADMVFITAGMGGGTGTGAAPKIAKIAKDNGCLTVAIVTMPFDFEGKKRRERAELGVRELKKNVDTLIVVPNQKLLKIVDRETGLKEAFRTADSILYQATKGISDLINNQGLMNLDFADIVSIMKDKGDAIMGTGVATGDSRASLAAQLAISSPLLDEKSIRGATGILINISGGPDVSLLEYDEACKIITDEAGSDADIIVGAIEDERFKDEIVITVIATGFPDENNHKADAELLIENHEFEEDTNDPIFTILKDDPFEKTHKVIIKEKSEIEINEVTSDPTIYFNNITPVHHDKKPEDANESRTLQFTSDQDHKNLVSSANSSLDLPANLTKNIEPPKEKVVDEKLKKEVRQMSGTIPVKKTSGDQQPVINEKDRQISLFPSTVPTWLRNNM
ncbi:MAG: cell division protein FtsZ [Candidatus Marinimicrobia bacterium]|nr:cell division protein FtsZ [Candidatus Neomarinimicrobiota bacterium]